MALRIRRKSVNEIQRQAEQIASRLSGGYAQPLDRFGNTLSVDREIYDSPTARRNRTRIERVVNTANRYVENISKTNSTINEPYRNAEQYRGVAQAKATKYPMMTYANITPNAMQRQRQSPRIAAKGNIGG
jgi:hypothetical protein